MKVALRDDDTSYFTEPERLEARVSRRVGSHAGRPRRGAARGGLRRQGDSRKVLARRPRLSARGESRRWWTRCATLVAGRPRHDRAARLHARGFSGRPRVPGRARLESAPRARPGVSRAACSTRASACSCRRTTRCRSAGWRRSAPPGLNLLGSFLSFRPSMRPWDCARRPTGGASAQYRATTGRSEGRSHGLSARAALSQSRRVRLPRPDSRHDVRGAGGAASTRRARPAGTSASRRTTGKSTPTLKSVLRAVSRSTPPASRREVRGRRAAVRRRMTRRDRSALG